MGLRADDEEEEDDEGRRTLHRWTDEEHQTLTCIIEQNLKTFPGPIRWPIVASELGTGRTGKQCRERWMHARPEARKGDWDAEEEQQLAHMHARLGPAWSRMHREMPARSENTIKNHWNALMRCKTLDTRPATLLSVYGLFVKGGRPWGSETLAAAQQLLDARTAAVQQGKKIPLLTAAVRKAISGDSASQGSAATGPAPAAAVTVMTPTEPAPASAPMPQRQAVARGTAWQVGLPAAGPGGTETTAPLRPPGGPSRAAVHQNAGLSRGPSHAQPVTVGVQVRPRGPTTAQPPDQAQHETPQPNTHAAHPEQQLLEPADNRDTSADRGQWSMAEAAMAGGHHREATATSQQWMALPRYVLLPQHNQQQQHQIAMAYEAVSELERRCAQPNPLPRGQAGAPGLAPLQRTSWTDDDVQEFDDRGAPPRSNARHGPYLEMPAPKRARTAAPPPYTQPPLHYPMEGQFVVMGGPHMNVAPHVWGEGIGVLPQMLNPPTARGVGPTQAPAHSMVMAPGHFIVLGQVAPDGLWASNGAMQLRPLDVAMLQPAQHAEYTGQSGQASSGQAGPGTVHWLQPRR